MGVKENEMVYPWLRSSRERLNLQFEDGAGFPPPPVAAPEQTSLPQFPRSHLLKLSEKS